MSKETVQIHVRKSWAGRAIVAAIALLILSGFLLMKSVNLADAFVAKLVFAIIPLSLIVFILFLLCSRIYDFFRISPAMELGPDGLRVRQVIKINDISWNDIKSAEFSPYRDGRWPLEKDIVVLFLKLKTSELRNRSQVIRFSASNLELSPKEFEDKFMAYKRSYT